MIIFDDSVYNRNKFLTFYFLDKLTTFNTFANELITEVQDQEIQTRTKEVRQLWDDLMELAMARKEALAGAKKVHSFDKKIDDTLDWILEKEALLSIDVNCQDSETIQELKQKQLGLRQDVKAINEQVSYLHFFLIFFMKYSFIGCCIHITYAIHIYSYDVDHS